MELEQLNAYFDRFKIKAQLQKSSDQQNQVLKIEKEIDQFIKFAKVMKQMGYTSSIPLSGEEVFKLANTKNSPLKNWKFKNSLGNTIIVQIQDDIEFDGDLLNSPTKLISLKVPEDLLKEFKNQAQKKGHRYQTLIKQLMLDWLQKS